MAVVYDSAKQRITLGPEIGHGGEAIVYRVQGQANLLAKLYVPPIHPHYAPKVAWMKDHPPEEPDYSVDIDEHQALAWPIDLLYDAKGRFAGYLMPRIQGGVTLLKVFNPRLRAQSLPFDRKYLHRIARNLAAAVASLHAKGYVVGDLHESNVIVTPQALVTMIDTDSFQVHAAVDDKAVCYRCVVGKPEYTAPELQGQRLADVTRGPEQDNFALAVLIFQLLMEGNHPFRSRWVRAGDPPPLEEKIARGLFPHVKPPPKPVVPAPNVPSLDTLHPTLSTAMQRCFVDGHKEPHLRPTAAEWRDGLETAEAALVQCRKGHYHESHLSKCPQCGADERAARRAAMTRRRQAVSTAFPPRIQHRQRQAAGTAARPRAATRPQPPPPWYVQLLNHLQQLPRALILAIVIPILTMTALILTVAGGVGPGARQAPTPTAASTMAPTPTTIPTPPLYPVQQGTPLPLPRAIISSKNVAQIVPLAHLSQDGLLKFLPPNGEQFAVFRRGSIDFYDTETLYWTRSIATTDREITSVAVSPDGALIAIGAAYQIELVEVTSGSRVLAIGEPTHNEYVNSLVFSPGGNLLAGGSVGTGQGSQPTVKVWDVATGQEIVSLGTEFAIVHSIAFSPDGKLLAAGTRQLIVWNISTGREVYTGDAHTPQKVTFSPDGAFLASLGAKVKIWDALSGTEVLAWGNFGDSRFAAESIAFSLDGKLLAVGGRISPGDQYRTRFLNVSTGNEIHALSDTLAGHLSEMTFSPDGTLLASDSHNGAIFLGIPSMSASTSPVATPGAPTPPIITLEATSGAIGGTVIDASTRLPIPGANVTTDPSTGSVTTDSAGMFVILNMPPGNYTVTATKPSYAIESVPVSVQAGEVKVFSIYLSASTEPSATPTPEPTQTPMPTTTLTSESTAIPGALPLAEPGVLPPTLTPFPEETP